ncbi:T7SS effector LXG polymorphic toxin [Priestia aryabhattai]|uniref:T7SS effector LXG polymorphic toxin n=1 Tax=Priestia aryabhattai TaxID=412384 RepID=UPI00203CC436|nr:T7SS effector LXG polymorphic toxin [Priestia aryabhattai]MCM3770908.1 T7SS effector LXG polymorphic toxin [Priestia aryabhattai]
MGKVYEASTLMAYAKDRVQAYKAFDEQLDTLKKALHAVATLDHEFQGKGADSIKGFYTSQVDIVTHWKSLVSSHQAYFNSIADYAERAKLEGNTVVDVSFLEQELAVANDRSKQMVEQQHAELESILSNIEDIIHITPFSKDAFEEDLSATEKKRTDTITAVEELDNQLSSEYGMLDNFYESVQFSVNGLEQLTSQGGSAYQLTFDAKAYKNSEAYKTQQQIDKVASGYVEGKAEQKQEVKERKAAIEAERQRQIQANKPWYEKGLDIAGELTGYYDFKRAADGVDPVTHKKLSATQRVTAGAMAAAGFIPFVGWAGRAVKGGSVVYKTAKGMSAAHHAMALYQTPKAFKVLEQTEKGLYGLVLTNGMYEYTMGKDLLGNKLTKEEQQASLFQSLGIAAGGLLAAKASTQFVEKSAQAVTKKFNDMRNVVRTSKVTQYGKDIQQAMRKMPATGIDKAKKMYDAVLDAKVPRFLPQEAPVGVSVDFAQQTVRDVLKSTAKDTMHFMKSTKLSHNSKHMQNSEWGVKSDKVTVGTEKLVGNLEDVDELLIDTYANMRKNKEVTGQAHHLSQDAAFRDVIPRKEGLAIELSGNIFKDIGSPHYSAHESLEAFWNSYRRNGESFGEIPMVSEYNDALYESLKSAGLSDTQSQQAVQRAFEQQVSYGLNKDSFVPRIPGRINLPKLK